MEQIHAATVTGELSFDFSLLSKKSGGIPNSVGHFPAVGVHHSLLQHTVVFRKVICIIRSAFFVKLCQP